MRVTRKAWSSDFDWSSTHFAIFRTPWDYSQRFDEFSAWLKNTRTKTHFINPLALIYWNSDKHYLQDLKDRGVNIPPTFFIHKGDQVTLAGLQKKLGWSEMVLKPTISAAARHTYRLNRNNLAAHEGIFQELIAKEDMMLQHFLKNIITKGKVALMMIGNELTHAMLKKAKEGDFRVQDDFGGSVHEYAIGEAETAFAKKVMEACPSLPLYTRIDVVWDNDGNMAVSELEIFEPEMWFRRCPSAADKLADDIERHVKSVLTSAI